MRKATWPLFACAAALALAAPAAAETIRLDFADQPNRSCGSAWSMSGLDLRMLPLAQGCVAYATQYGWILGRTCLEIDVGTLGGVRSVSASFLNYDADNGFGIYLLDDVAPVASGWNVSTSAPDTLVVPAGSSEVRRVRVFCYNCFLFTFTVEFEALDTETVPWGTVKALYR